MDNLIRWHDVIRTDKPRLCDDRIVFEAFAAVLQRKLHKGYSVHRFVLAIHTGIEWKVEVELSDKPSNKTALEAMERLKFKFVFMPEDKAEELWRSRGVL